MPPRKKAVSTKVVQLLQKKSRFAPTKTSVPHYLAEELKYGEVLGIKELIAEVLTELESEGTVLLSRNGNNITSVELVGYPIVPPSGATPSDTSTESTPRKTVTVVPNTLLSHIPSKTTSKEIEPMNVSTTTKPLASTPPATAKLVKPFELIEKLATKAEQLQADLEEMTRQSSRLEEENAGLKATQANKLAEFAQLTDAMRIMSTALDESNTLNASLKQELEVAKRDSSSMDELALRVASLVGPSA